jgi:hypothetical protein
MLLRMKGCTNELTNLTSVQVKDICFDRVPPPIETLRSEPLRYGASIAKSAYAD